MRFLASVQDVIFKFSEEKTITPAYIKLSHSLKTKLNIELTRTHFKSVLTNYFWDYFGEIPSLHLGQEEYYN